MSNVSFTNRGINLDTGRVAASSKRADFAKNTEKQTVSPSYRREVPFLNDEGTFVEISGKRYNLNAPRGTYVNILV